MTAIAESGNKSPLKEWERHAHKKRNNPTDESGALLKGVMLILSANTHATLLSRGATQLCVLSIIFYPVVRSSCRKLPFAGAILIVC